MIGLGGLGCPALLHLAAAGIRRIGIADYDKVEISNLPRQILYSEDDLETTKVEAARKRLMKLPSAHSLTVETFNQVVRGDEDWLESFQVIIDAADRADVKMQLHDSIVGRKIPYVHAGASGWEAQGLTIENSACLRCLFGQQDDIEVPDCSRAGVVGPVVGLVGRLAGEEAVRIFYGEEPAWRNNFFTMDAKTGRTRSVTIKQDSTCTICAC